MGLGPVGGEAGRPGEGSGLGRIWRVGPRHGQRGHDPIERRARCCCCSFLKNRNRARQGTAAAMAWAQAGGSRARLRDLAPA